MTSARPAVYLATRLTGADLARLSAACDLGVREAAGPLTRPELFESLGASTGLLCVNDAPFDGAFFAAVPPSLRVISQIGVGCPSECDAARLVQRPPPLLSLRSHQPLSDEGL